MKALLYSVFIITQNVPRTKSCNVHCAPFTGDVESSVQELSQYNAAEMKRTSIHFSFYSKYYHFVNFSVSTVVSAHMIVVHVDF